MITHKRIASVALVLSICALITVNLDTIWSSRAPSFVIPTEPVIDHPTASPVTDNPTPEPPRTLVNNQVTYPRKTAELLSPSKARELSNRISALRNSQGIYQPPEGTLLRNWERLDRLENVLRKGAESGKEIPRPQVVLSSWHWIPCAYGECTTGEVQWFRPIADIMWNEGTTFLFSEWQNFREDSKLLGNDLITHAWMDDEHVIECIEDRQKCLQSVENPDALPLWKLFAFTFWGSKPHEYKWKSPGTPWSFNPLGSEWNLVPYEMPEGQFYLGYHYQNCHSLSIVPYDQRPNQIVILAKLSEYFHRDPVYDPATFYITLKNATGYDIITNADPQEGFPIPEGLDNKGLLPMDEYDRQLSNTKVLLGIGKPILSPTPYASLCRGVPVILPYRSDKGCVAQPSPDRWCGFDQPDHQHGPASRIGEPYIYTVDWTGPVEDIIKTIQRAVNTPIEPFVPEDMTKESVRGRVLDFFAIDWEAHARSKGWGGTNSRKPELPQFLKEWVKNQLLKSENQDKKRDDYRPRTTDVRDSTPRY